MSRHRRWKSLGDARLSMANSTCKEREGNEGGMAGPGCGEAWNSRIQVWHPYMIATSKRHLVAGLNTPWAIVIDVD